MRGKDPSPLEVPVQEAAVSNSDTSVPRSWWHCRFLFRGKNGEEENNFLKLLTPNLIAVKVPMCRSGHEDTIVAK